MIESILAKFGYVKKPRTRMIIVTYQYMYGSSENIGNVWFQTDKTGQNLRLEIVNKCADSATRSTNGGCPRFVITNISDLG